MVIKRKATPFFTDEEFRDVIVNESQDSACMECGLYKNCISPKMPVTGKGKKEILILAEGPGCIAGDSLIDVAYRDKSIYPKGIPIRDLVGRDNFHVYSFDKEKKKLVLGKVKKVWCTGTKPVYKVSYKWRFSPNEWFTDSLIVTKNHPFLLIPHSFKNPFNGVNTNKQYSYLSIEQGLSVGHSVLSFSRNVVHGYSFIGFKGRRTKEARYLLEQKMGRGLKKGEQCHHINKNKKDDTFNNLQSLFIDEHSRLHITRDNPMFKDSVIKKHKDTMQSMEYRKKMSVLMKEKLKDPILYKKRIKQLSDSRGAVTEKIKVKFKTDPVYYFNYLMGRVNSDAFNVTREWAEKKFWDKYPNEELPIYNHMITDITYVGMEKVYDMEVESYHNFVANGVFVHNSKEDEQNKQLIGEAGQLLRSRLKDCGLSLDEDFWKTNSVCCRTPKNRKPKRKELKCCKPNYVKLINELKPKFIWLVGAAAIESYYMDHFADEDGTVLTPTRWRGLCIPDQMSGAWVIPMFHPSFALRNEKDNLLQSQFNRDISFAVNQLQRKAPKFIHPEKRVTVLKEFDDVCENLDKLIYEPPEFLAFDYETTGLKPFNDGHKIACIGYAVDDRAYSFPFEYPHFTAKQVSTLKKMWGEVLKNDSYKIAHNLKYEDVWSRVIIGSLVQNWHWCTMNAAHILDNRKKFSSLKFQSFIRWGVGQYDKTVSPFLKDKTGSGFNRVMEADLDDLLLYNGMDCLLTMKLYREQYNEMPVPMMKANDFFIDGLIALSDVQINGIPAKRKYYEKTDKELEDRMKEITKELLVSKEAKKFEKEMGRTISLTSDYDMRDLFFKILKYTPSKSTDTGLPSVDAASLRSLNSPFANKLIELSQLDKIKTTYIGQFLREINDDGKLHPFFDLHTVQTYRSSSAGPNIQNIPSRDPVAKKYTRSGLYPSPGNLILDFDYGALEVRIIGACTGDPELVRYINDPSTDMHRDQAMLLFDLKKKEVTKMLRFHAKNGFVFAEFYGSYYRSIARSLWETMNRDQLKTATDVNIFDHLMDNKIINHEKDFDKFESHVKDVEQSFWDRFSGVKKWQKRNWDFYERNGYVELATGFRCSGYMKRNDLANYPIQGPAFHCLLYSLININDELKRRKMGTKIIGQIHDCCLFDCVPSEKDAVKEMSIEIATKKIREDWKWLNVPLVLEFEETKVDESWYSKKEVREE